MSAKHSNTKNQNEGMLKKYALVLTCIGGLGVKTFSYLIPDGLKTEIKIGQAVKVPFGRMGLINAFVVGFSDYLPEDIKAKKIAEILDTRALFDLEYLKFLEWVANYYFCSLQSVLECAIPLKFLQMHGQSDKYVEFKNRENATKRQKEILEKLETSGKMRLIDFEKEAKTTRATINKLEKAGCLEISEEAVFRNPLEIFKEEDLEPFPDLTDEQKSVCAEIEKRLGKSGQILIHGVTS